MINPHRQPFIRAITFWGLLLLLFDIEAAFLFPWTVVYRYLGVFGFVEMFLFIFILTYGLLYAWRKGALDWQFEEEYID
jgi:NADH-quinone oxidoreductase subunit A